MFLVYVFFLERELVGERYREEVRERVWVWDKIFLYNVDNGCS
jgi:hypothetical protein